MFIKAYCRIYQGIFKIGMNFIPWRMSKTIEGPGCVEKLPSLIKEKGYSKILVVTDSVISQLGLLDGLYDALKKEQIDFVVYSGVQPNPTDVNVEEGLNIYCENDCEAMIAFGGGSPMDCSKTIGARYAKKHKSVKQLQGLFKVFKRIPTIFAVPTTAGTGSETTVAAVITDAETHHKGTIMDTFLMPPYAVLDPCLTIGLPPHVTSTTGLDALAHAVEAYTNNTYNTKLEKKLAEDAVRLIYDNLYKAYCDGHNLEARQNMQKAAYFAGRAFTRGCVGYVHAMGHTFSGIYGTPHGLSMSIILPYVMRQFGSAVYVKLARLADICGMEGSCDKEKAEAFISWIEEMKEKMDIPSHLDVIKEEDIPQIISWSMKEANPLYPVPVIWGREDFKRCIDSVRG